jgi:serine/threonine-protein kinase
MVDPTRTAPPSDARQASKEPTAATVAARTHEDEVRLAEGLPALEGSARYPRGPLLGAGGMGAVELRRDARIGRRVAYKTLHAELDEPDMRQRFLREALIQAQLEHPSIVPVYEVGDGEEGVFFTMQRVRGRTLSRVIDGLVEGDPEIRARFNERRLLTAFVQVCQALHHAHARGVVHRDLKPSNIMLGELGEVYVLDWGIARVGDDPPIEAEPRTSVPPLAIDTGPRMTASDAVLGTLAYMAPEQLAGVEVDARADVYALGLVLYEILTHKHFRASATYPSVVGQIADGRVARPSDVRPDVDPELDAICARATAIAAFDRFESAKALADAVERVLDGVRDAEARATAATRHLERARALLASEPRRDVDRDRAMHELLRAVTLDPTATEARELLVELLSHDDVVPEAAKPDVERADTTQRLGGLEGTMMGLASWLLPVPLVIAFIEVRSWTYLGLTAGLTLLAMAHAAIARARRDVRSGTAYVLALLLAGILVASSFILGPFAIVPTMAATCSMFFAMHVRPRERWVVTAILALGAVAPFALEINRVVPPGFLADDGRLVLLPRMLELPPEASILALTWVSGSFAVFSAIITGRMRDRLERAERRNIVSAWHLRRLFEAPEASASR